MPGIKHAQFFFQFLQKHTTDTGGRWKLFYSPVVLHIVALNTHRVLCFFGRKLEGKKKLRKKTIKFSTTARYTRVYRNKTAGNRHSQSRTRFFVSIFRFFFQVLVRQCLKVIFLKRILCFAVDSGENKISQFFRHFVSRHKFWPF